LEPFSLPHVMLSLRDYLEQREAGERTGPQSSDVEKANEKTWPGHLLACSLEHLANRLRDALRIFENMPVSHILQDLHAHHIR